MYTMGIDIGSTTSKTVIVLNGRQLIADSVIKAGAGTSGPLRALEEALSQAQVSLKEMAWIVATGYGRINFQMANEQISEISCQAKGVHFLMASARTVLDIGGQDAKAIQIGERGEVLNFVMNEKCAAGRGVFLR